MPFVETSTSPSVNGAAPEPPVSVMFAPADEHDGVVPHPLFLVNDTPVVGGIGFGARGSATFTGCGNCTMPPATVAEPLSVSASTAPLAQLPTPVRGVYRV